MKKVHLILDNAVAGQVELYADALASPNDFKCAPPGIISFLHAREVACRVAEGGTWGYIERYRWQLVPAAN